MDTNKRSPTPENPPPEDPDTAAARKELRQTVISERPDLSTMSTAKVDPAPNAIPSGDKASSKKPTSDRDSLEPQNDDLKDKMSSPKKKRARDELDESREAPSDANGDVSPIGADAGTSRSDRSEPEKKRPRDVSSESRVNLDTPATASESKSSESKEDPKSDKQTSEKQATKAKDHAGTEKENKSITSTSAFNSSGIASFASQASPFLQAGSKPLSSFASPSTSQSPFGAAASPAKTSVFGSTSLSNGASPFGQVGGTLKSFGSSVFGGGGTFGNKLGGSTLTSFGKPGESFKSSKPTKPFGAPAGDEGDNGKEDGNSEDEDKNDNEDNEAQEGESVAADDKKKQPKLQRVVVDDGEAGESTILQVRAKIYHLDKASSSWKERGAGNLKINVPSSCVEFDETGAPIPGSFDMSALEKAESKVVRLVMRQDSTHRVILNTVIIPAMKFQEKSTIKATCVLFTAIEDDGAVSIQLKMNETNAKSFLNEVGKIQRELQLA